MLSPPEHYGLGAKFCGLGFIGFGLNLDLTLMYLGLMASINFYVIQ